MDLSLTSADAYCRYLTRHHYENFIVSLGLVDASTRRDLARVYAYCRTTDDLGDESGTQAVGRLARWRSEVEAMFAGEVPIHPVLLALRETVARHGLAAQPFLALISANDQDQTVVSYQTWDELEAYCMLSAAPVGRMVLGVFGVQDAIAGQLSDDVCIGLQLANHAQDVARDAAIGRRYLIASDVRANGVRGAIRALVVRARELLGSGVRLERMVPFGLRWQLALYRLGGLAICDAIERMGFATDRQRPIVGTRARLGVLARALVESSARAAKVRDVELA